MAYAIVKTGGKQYRVEQGQTLLVERLPEEAGATVELRPLLFRSTDTVFDAEAREGVGQRRRSSPTSAARSCASSSSSPSAATSAPPATGRS